MKKIIALTITISMLVAGCSRSVGNTVEENIADSAGTSEVVTEWVDTQILETIN